MTIVEIVDELDGSAPKPDPNRVEKILEKLRKYEQEQARTSGDDEPLARTGDSEPTADGSVDVDMGEQ